MARGNPLFIGIGSTKLFLAFLTLLALLPQREGSEWSWRLWSFFLAPSNEIGDTLAGIAGALAFLWIIVTVMLQSKELAAQREELQLTRKEFRRMAEAQDQQVALLVEQGKIFSKEQKQREQEVYHDVLDQKLVGIWYQMTSVPLSWVSWVIPESCYEDMDYDDQAKLFNLPETDDIHRVEKLETPEERDSRLRLQAHFLGELVGTLDQCAVEIPKDRLPEKPTALDFLIRDIKKLIDLEEFLSEAQKERLRNLLIIETYFHLQTISETKEWWSSEVEVTHA